MQDGCYWQQLHPELADTPPKQTGQAGIVAEVSLSPSGTSLVGSEEAESPSEVPAPDSQSQGESSPASPITVGSSQEGQDEQAEPQSQETEQLEEPTSAEVIASGSEAGNAQEAALDASPLAEMPSTTEYKEHPGAEQATETESSTSDAIIEIDVDEEAVPAQAEYPAKETGEAPRAPEAPWETPMRGADAITTPSPCVAPADTEKTGVKRPASLASLHDEGQRRAPPSSSVASSSEVKTEGGHPRGCPSASPTGNNVTEVPAGKAQRRSRWAANAPTVTALPPQGVDRTSDTSLSPTSPVEQATARTDAAPLPSAALRPRLQGPLAVKSKAVKPTDAKGQETEEQGLVNAIQFRLQTPAAADRGLLGLVADKPPVTAAANPQMPSVPAAGSDAQTSGSPSVLTKEINLRAADEAS